MMNLKVRSALLLATGATLLGCELDDSCDPGQELHPDFKLCVDPSEEEMGGASGDDTSGSTGEDCPEPVELVADMDTQNVGDSCDDLIEECDGYTGTQCVGGTICGGERFPQCIALCGPGDPFEDECPDGYTCTNLGEASLCWQ